VGSKESLNRATRLKPLPAAIFCAMSPYSHAPGCSYAFVPRRAPVLSTRPINNSSVTMPEIRNFCCTFHYIARTEDVNMKVI